METNSTPGMKEHSISYAYPSSENAAKHGCSKQGCYILKTQAVEQPFQSLEAAQQFASTLGTVPVRWSLDHPSQAALHAKGRDYAYEIRVGGETFMKGDAGSIGMLFGNLDGRNFKPASWRNQTHAEWLAYMAKEYQTELSAGAGIQLVNHEGVVLNESEIGKHADAAQPA